MVNFQINVSTDSLQASETIFSQTLKLVLGVRRTTCNDLVYVELGIGDAKAHIRDQQRSYLRKIMARPNFSGSYIDRIIEMARNSRCPSWLVLQSILSEGAPDCYADESLEKIRAKIRTEAATSTRRATYLSMNPELARHSMYDTVVPERHRMATTRIRLGSHRLRAETGRWARIPRELRVCPCGNDAVQDEEHVMTECPHSDNLRLNFQNLNFDSISHLMDSEDINSLCKYIYEILKRFE